MSANAARLPFKAEFCLTQFSAPLLISPPEGQTELFEQRLNGDFVAVPALASAEELNLVASPSQAEQDCWLNEENLQAMAEGLAQCESAQQLGLLRQCWLPQSMNLACQRLSPEKHAQIKQWVIELNESVATTDS